MSRECYYTGKRTSFGNTIARRGKAKYLGGVGRKITGISRRKFKPNIQKVRAIVDGSVRRVRVSAKALKMGLVVKRQKRNYKPFDSAQGGPAEKATG
jgi:large subunit ribosomal protein L28